MRRLMILWLMTLLAMPVFAANRVTVDQLSHVIDSSRKRKDAKVARHLYDLQLTQRLSSQKLHAFEEVLPGPDSRRALVALADEAEFLDPPPAEIPDKPAPSIPEQRAIIAKSIAYVEATLHRLPNLFARRDTIRFRDTPFGTQQVESESPRGTFYSYQPLHPVSRSVVTVLYRDGQEIVQNEAAQEVSATAPAGLMTFGEFGPIFPVVYGDLPYGNLRWSHWEQGPAGLEAVFRFNVPRAHSHFLVRYCCINNNVFQQFPAYHGEINVDPSNGTILRLALIADMTRNDPMTEAELMLQYGPVELGGKTYFCPLKSISLSRARVEVPGASQPPGIPAAAREGVSAIGSSFPAVEGASVSETHAPLQTMLNEVVFDHYHLFRADMQILTGANSQAGPALSGIENAPSGITASNPAPLPGQLTSMNQQPSPAAPPASMATVAQPSNPIAAKSATPPAATSQPTVPLGAPAMAKSTAPTSVPSMAPSSTAPKESSPSEMAVVASAPFLQSSTLLSETVGRSGYSLSVSTRLVNVDVTAFDKNGRPITSLRKKDFVVYDEGRKQTLQSFSQVSGASSIAGSPSTAATPVLYSNLPTALGSGGTKAARASAPESSTILLLDPTSLDFGDLTRARHQILDFLSGLPKSEPVGLYVRTGPGFQILAQESTDHAALASVLNKWMPSAKDLARAHEEQMRNRQQFDTVESPSDMQYVNGNVPGRSPMQAGSNLTTIMTNEGGNPTGDPKLTKEGQTPVREALAALTAVAAHMDAIPGQKNLVWVASDNVLANWTDMAPGMEQGDGANTIGVLALRAQEALNDAHVSLYPLDASQLETSATNASLQNNSVQLNLGVRDLYPDVGVQSYLKDGRAMAQLRQDVHAVQPAIQHMAEATGGRAFPRAGNMVGELNSVIEAGNSAYLLSFSPDTPPDGKYHRITVAVPGQRGIHLRYRAGYLYTKEPTTLKARFQQAIWQPQDETGIGLTAHWDHASQGAAVSLQIAATDIALKQQGGLWTGRLDIFLVQRDGPGIHATVKEQTLVLNLKPTSYQKVLYDGIPFAEFVEHQQAFGTVRVIVVDENSGRMGSVTLPVMPETANR